MTPEEAGLIQRFRRLGSPGRNQLLHFARFLCNEPAENNEDAAEERVETLFPPIDSSRRDT